MRKLLGCTAVAAVLLGASAIPSGAATMIPIGGPNTAIGLGSSSLATEEVGANDAFTVDYFFNLTAPGMLSANALDGTSAGATAINPFSLTLEIAGGSVLGTTSSPTSSGSTESIQLSGVSPLSAGVNYELVVSGTNTLGTTVDVDGNVFISSTPLPGALPLFASSIVGFWAWSRKRKGHLAGSFA